jgi:hypothetical protein
MSGAIPPLPQYASMASCSVKCIGTTLPLPFYLYYSICFFTPLSLFLRTLPLRTSDYNGGAVQDSGRLSFLTKRNLSGSRTLTFQPPIPTPDYWTRLDSIAIIFTHSKPIYLTSILILSCRPWYFR